MEVELELLSGAENLSENNFGQHKLFQQVVSLIRGYSSRESKLVFIKIKVNFQFSYYLKTEITQKYI